MTSLLRSGAVLLYSLALLALLPCVRLLARLNPRIRRQLQGRQPVDLLARAIAPARARKRQAAVFFCSSAGEFEQARPLIDRLEKQGDTYVHAIFFSKSGFDYIKSRNESVPSSLAPLTDSVWHWGWLFAALRPQLTVVVRHELWPGFLETARQYGKVVLIDASCSAGEAATARKRWLRGQLLRFFDRIYAVSGDDKNFFIKNYALSPDRVLITGDTKYDRVRERAAAQGAAVEKLRLTLQQVQGTAAHRLVIGSAHPPDLAVCLAARQQLGATAESWQVVVAPHHVTPEMIAGMEAACRSAGLSVGRYSELVSPGAAGPSAGATWSVLILDVMGLLAEAYGTADAAFVGGAMHHQVHNVLEPATRGLALAYGPFYKNSQEAVLLVQAGLAMVTEQAPALAGWWRQLSRQLAGNADASSAVDPSGLAVVFGTSMTEAVAALAGAADRIMADWPPLLTDQGPRQQAPALGSER